ncbi:hypothetical protein Tco_1496209 [Tanacetum coccineum]
MKIRILLMIKKRRRKRKDEMILMHPCHRKTRPQKVIKEGKVPFKSSKIDKTVKAKELVQDVAMDAEELIEDDVIDAQEPTHDDDAPEVDKSIWFKQVMVDAEKDPKEFDDLLGSTINFTKFAKNCLKKDKLMKADLEGLAFALLKGNFKNSIELEYNMEKCYLALTNQIDWLNPEGDICPYDLSKPLPLQEIVVRRADQKEYRFNEANFSRLHLNDIEDMFLLYVQNKLHRLTGKEQVDLVNDLRLFIRRIVVKKRVE